MQQGSHGGPGISVLICIKHLNHLDSGGDSWTHMSNWILLRVEKNNTGPFQNLVTCTFRRLEGTQQSTPVKVIIEGVWLNLP